MRHNATKLPPEQHALWSLSTSAPADSSRRQVVGSRSVVKFFGPDSCGKTNSSRSSLTDFWGKTESSRSPLSSRRKSSITAVPIFEIVFVYLEKTEEEWYLMGEFDSVNRYNGLRRENWDLIIELDLVTCQAASLLKGPVNIHYTDLHIHRNGCGAICLAIDNNRIRR